MNKKFDSVFKDLESINQQSIVSVYVPSLDAFKKFKPISVLQQKKIISAINNSALDSVALINVLNNIIAENACEECNANVLDREFILMHVRVDDESQNDAKNFAQVMQSKDISGIIEGTFNYQDAIKVEMQMPSLQRDTEFNAWFIEKNKDKKATASEIAANYFVLEIVKYIKSIHVNNECVDFANAQDVEDLIKIAEQLPTIINNAVAKFIANGKELVENVFASRNRSTQTPLF